MFKKEEILDLLFPRRCIGCGFFVAHARWSVPRMWCDVCEQTRRADLPLEGGREGAPIFSAQNFECASVASAIHALKYGAYIDAADVCARWIAERCGPRMNAESFSSQCSEIILIPVPLHPAKFRVRGYNQAELVAEQVAAHCQSANQSDMHIGVRTDLLIRTRFSQAQAQSALEDRTTQIAGAFACRQGAEIKNKNALYVVVDDVFTTGSTLSACIIALRDAGAEQLCAVTVASASTSAVTYETPI